MKGVLLLTIVSFVLIVDRVTAQWASTGLSNSYTYYIANLGVNDAIVWSFKNKTSNYAIAIFQCSQFYERCDLSDNKFKELYSANLITNSSTITSVFTINSVTPFQHNSTWMCKTNRQGSNVSEQYNLYVFALPESPTCDNVTLLNENNIHIACVTQKGFPRSVCIFYVMTNKSEPAEVKNGHINYTHEEDVTTGYYKTTCAYTVFADFLGPGTHMFYVVMYPDIASTITEEMKKKSQYTIPIVISYPEAVLASDCKVNSYVKENETGHCTCYNNKSNFLTTHITWSTGESKFESKGEINSFTLNFTARRSSNENQSFRCIISNTLNWTTTIIFNPQVIYGPDSIKIVVNNPENDKCDYSSVQIVGTCLVSESNPFATVYSIVNNSWTQLKPGIEKNVYSFTMSLNSTTTFNVSCYANNSIFGDISSLNSEYVTLKGTPKSPHITSISNSVEMPPSNNVITLYEGITTVICELEEKVLFHSNISLTCGDFQRSFKNPSEYGVHLFFLHCLTSEDADIVFLILNLVRESRSIICSCDVWYESKCPKISVSVKINVFQIQSDDTKENNGLAIGFGVAAGFEFLALLVVTIAFFRFWKKQKLETNHSAKKISEAYSDLKDTHFKEQTDTYEMPILPTAVSSQYQTCNSEIVIEPYNSIPPTSSDELGGFIVTYDVKVEENHFETKEITENFSKNEEHPYEEVKDQFEGPAGGILKNNTSYSNVKLN